MAELRRSSSTTWRHRPRASLAEAPLDPHLAEANPLVERQANDVLGQHARQERPVPSRLRRSDEHLEQSA